MVKAMLVIKGFLEAVQMKIKWLGKYDGSNLPAADVSAYDKTLPEITTKSAWVLIPFLLVFAFFCFCKHRYFGGLAFSRGNWAIGIGIGLLFCPVHELLHAICYPAGSRVFMFYTMQGLGTTCTTPISRNRFILVNALPAAVLGGISFILFLAVPSSHARLSTILWAFSMLHLGAGYVDFLNIVHSLKIPRSATIQISGARIYWKER